MSLSKLLLFLLAYLVGSIPFGLIFSKIFAGKDVRTLGSGNIGTANVIRNLGWSLGLLTFLCDLLKGLLPVVIGMRYFDLRTAIVAGLLSVLGHIFSIFLKFSGGKGVATAFGVMLGINYMTALLSFLVFIVVLLLFRISSLSSLLATLSNLMFNIVFFSSRDVVLLNILLMVLIFYKHKKNIVRLTRGEEPRMWGKKG